MSTLYSPLLAAALACTAVAGPVQNGTFDNNPPGINPWQALGTTPGLSVALSNADAVSAPWALRVTGRGAATDGPLQTQGLLAALSNGTTYVSRCRLKLDAPAQVRMLLLIASSTPQTPFILAEKVVRSGETGQWLSLEGVQKVAWTGNATAARIYFAVEQIYPGTVPAGAFPSYSLDNVSMDPDADGDGLSNAEEITTSPNTRDTDGDTMPDKWELVHGLNPNSAADATLDPDYDGCSNRREYRASTDPQSAASFPGLTSDPLASPATKSLVFDLQTRGVTDPWRYYSGHHAQDIPADYNNFVAGLNTLMNAAGHPGWVSILSIAAEGPSAAQPLQITTSGPVLRSYMDAGGLGIIHWTPRNPWTNGNNGDHTGVDIANLLTPGTAANVRFTGWMDTIAAEFALFGPDRPIIFRPLSEQNGPWNWYGRLPQDEFIALYRWLRDYFVTTKGLHNIVWTIEEHIGVHRPLSFTNSGVSMDYYYPGDDVIDLIGFSNYVSGWNPGFDADAQSRLHPKAFAITEGGPPPNEDDVPNAYNSLYLPALDAWYPRAAFFVIWNSWPTGPFVAIKDNANYVELLTDPRVTNREGVNYLHTLGAWQIGNGILGQSLSDDPDADGLSNLLEAACGSAPLVPSGTAPAASFVTATGQTWPAITFTRDPSIADVTLAVEVSSDLITWTTGSHYGSGGDVPATTATTEVARTLSGGLETITVRSNSPSGTGRQFIRVTATPP